MSRTKTMTILILRGQSIFAFKHTSTFSPFPPFSAPYESCNLPNWRCFVSWLLMAGGSCSLQDFACQMYVIHWESTAEAIVSGNCIFRCVRYFALSLCKWKSRSICGLVYNKNLEKIWNICSSRRKQKKVKINENCRKRKSKRMLYLRICRQNSIPPRCGLQPIDVGLAFIQ